MRIDERVVRAAVVPRATLEHRSERGEEVPEVARAPAALGERDEGGVVGSNV